jgi:hypothetical protein
VNGVKLKVDPRALRTIEKLAMDALHDYAENIAETSARIAPIEEGTLIRSAQVSRDDRAGLVAISYDTPYAVVQHEDTQLRHDDGRRAKFLEDPVMAAADWLGPFVANHVRKATR